MFLYTEGKIAFAADPSQLDYESFSQRRFAAPSFVPEALRGGTFLREIGAESLPVDPSRIDDVGIGITFALKMLKSSGDECLLSDLIICTQAMTY